MCVYCVFHVFFYTFFFGSLICLTDILGWLIFSHFASGLQILSQFFCFVRLVLLSAVFLAFYVLCVLYGEWDVFIHVMLWLLKVFVFAFVLMLILGNGKKTIGVCLDGLVNVVHVLFFWCFSRFWFECIVIFNVFVFLLFWFLFTWVSSFFLPFSFSWNVFAYYFCSIFLLLESNVFFKFLCFLFVLFCLRSVIRAMLVSV